MTPDWVEFWGEAAKLGELTHPQQVLFDAKAWSATAWLTVRTEPYARPDRAPSPLAKARCPHCKLRVLVFEKMPAYFGRARTLAQVALVPMPRYYSTVCECGAEVRLDALMTGGYAVVLFNVRSTRDRIKSGELESGVIFNPAFDLKAYIDRRLAVMVLERLVREEGVTNWSEERTARVLRYVEYGGGGLVDAYAHELMMHGTGRPSGVKPLTPQPGTTAGD